MPRMEGFPPLPTKKQDAPALEQVAQEITAIAEKTAEVPPIVFHAPEMEQWLGPEEKVILEEQWKRFWDLRKQDIISTPDEQKKVGKGFLIHNLSLSQNSIIESDPGRKNNILETILASGVMSGELGYGEKATTFEDGETNFCADFFRAMEDRTIKEWVDYTRSTETGKNSLRIIKRVMEGFAAPDAGAWGTSGRNHDNDSISLVINPNHPELKDLLEYSTDGKTYTENPQSTPLSKFVNTFPSSGERHVAVLVGIPANFIATIIVGGKIEHDLERLTEMKGLLKKYQLSACVVNTAGETL